MADEHISIPTEVFKPIPDWPGYDVSNRGTVRSYWRRKGLGDGGGTVIVLDNKPYKILKHRLTTRGYPKVTLTKNGKHLTILVHSLILNVFVGPCPPGKECRHLDGVPAHCFLENLKWGSHSDNMLDQTRHGTNWDNKGMKSPVAKLSDEQVQDIRNFAIQGYTQDAIGKLFGISRSQVSHIVNRKSWAHLR